MRECHEQRGRSEFARQARSSLLHLGARAAREDLDVKVVLLQALLDGRSDRAGRAGEDG
jgi:hypothetical protein